MMLKPQGSLHNQTVRSPVGMEVYLLQLLVGGRGAESIVVGNMLEYESSKQEMV